MSQEEKAKWEGIYGEPGFRGGSEPRRWLSEIQPMLPCSGPALDLGAGEGQTAVFLAKLGFDVEAWDISDAALQKARALAAESSVDIAVRCLDLDDRPIIEPAKYTLITCLHFLKRDLVPLMKTGLRIGGLVAFEIAGTPNLTRHARPSRRYLVEPGELESWFPTFEPLHTHEDWVDDRFLCRLLARRVS